MYRFISHIAILIAFVASASADTGEENVRKKQEEQNNVLNKILEFRSADDGISYEYVEFDDDNTDEEEILLQDESDNFSPLGRLMTT
jgi:ABC-type metal ion transport system substrate-binding protein